MRKYFRWFNNIINNTLLNVKFDKSTKCNSCYFIKIKDQRYFVICIKCIFCTIISRRHISIFLFWNGIISRKGVKQTGATFSQ